VLLPRDGGLANLQGNISTAQANWFFDVAAGDLHLEPGGMAAVDSGAPLPGGWADRDFDHEMRDSLPDVGADEITDILFSDDFESGDLREWITQP